MSFIQYIIFCLGSGFIQSSILRQKNPLLRDNTNVLDSPPWLSAPFGLAVVPLLAIGALISEIILGIFFVSLWIGLILWIPAFIIAHFLLFSVKNAIIPLILGIIIISALVISLFV